MNLSRVSVGSNQALWMRLFSVSAAQSYQRKPLLSDPVLQNWQLSLTNPLCYSAWRNSTSINPRCGNKLLLTLNVRGGLKGNPSHPLLLRSGGLSGSCVHGLKMPAQGVHTGKGRETELRTDIPQTDTQWMRPTRQTKAETKKSNVRLTEDETQIPTLETEEDLTLLSHQVLEAAGKKDVMVETVPLSQVEQLVLDLHHCGWEPALILSLLSTHPSLLLKRRSLLPTVHLLLDHGFDASQTGTILHHLPVIAQTSKSQINQAMTALRELGFGEKTVFGIVSHHPPLLLMSKAALSHRVMELRQLFKSVDVITLTVKCPGLLSDSWKDVQVKFDYVFHEMGVTQKQMVYASLFNHSLAHIKKRHTFLVRAGLFLTDKRKEGERSPNATLDLIIGTSDKAFCRRFGGFEVAEYRAFCQMFEKEQAASQDSDSDDDNDEK